MLLIPVPEILVRLDPSVGSNGEYPPVFWRGRVGEGEGGGGYRQCPNALY